MTVETPELVCRPYNNRREQRIVASALNKYFSYALTEQAANGIAFDILIALRAEANRDVEEKGAMYLEIVESKYRMATKLLDDILGWAEQRCPCHNEEPDPCPLCGAGVKNLSPCLSAENTIPRNLLARLREFKRWK